MFLSTIEEYFIAKRFILTIFLSTILLLPSAGHSQNLLCRPWQNVSNGIEIGESFTAKIKDGLISFYGEQKPVSFGQLIYSHPLNDIFIAASGELVVAGFEGKGIRVKVYFPNKKVQFFVTTSCVKV